MSNTPETDENARHNSPTWSWVTPGFARKLERERDELRAKLDLAERQKAELEAGAHALAESLGRLSAGQRPRERRANELRSCIRGTVPAVTHHGSEISMRFAGKKDSWETFEAFARFCSEAQTGKEP